MSDGSEESEEDYINKLIGKTEKGNKDQWDSLMAKEENELESLDDYYVDLMNAPDKGP